MDTMNIRVHVFTAPKGRSFWNKFPYSQPIIVYIVNILKFELFNSSLP